MRETVANALEEMRLGEAITHQNLTIFPIFDGPESPLSIIGLQEALAKGFLEVTEISEGGSVPNLKVTNKGEIHVLILDGEELKGAKQNRIVNSSILVAPQTEMVIPVSCTEQGRWNYNSRNFDSSANMLHSFCRSSKSIRVSKSLKKSNSYDADQGAIWSEVRGLSVTSKMNSATMAMSDMYEGKKKELDQVQKAVELQTGQKGMLVLKNGEAVAMDFVPSAAVYAALHEKLLASHAIGTIQEMERGDVVIDLESQAKILLQSPHLAEEYAYPSVGLGEDIRYEGARCGGAALVYDAAVMHINLFDTAGIHASKPKNSLETLERAFTNEYEQRRREMLLSIFPQDVSATEDRPTKIEEKEVANEA